MEERKEKEIKYYDKKAEEFLREESEKKWLGDFEGFIPDDLASYAFCYKVLKENCKGKKVLDYGCGNGVHSAFPVKWGAEKVVGIDLSESSLKIAWEKAKREGVEGRLEFVKMDCEKMEFPENSFDVIFDGGTFSSIDLKQAFSELARVLKPEGVLIGIETFGHNPFTNLKRTLNKIRGRRTGWAAEHIFRMEDVKYAGNYFNKIELRFFHLVSWIAFPFLPLPGAKILLKILEALDNVLLKLPFLRKYAFKAVFIFSRPKK